MAITLAKAAAFLFVFSVFFERAAAELDESENFFDPTDHGDYYEGDQGIFLPESYEDEQHDKNAFYTFNADDQQDDVKVKEENKPKRSNQKKDSIKTKLKSTNFLKKKRSLEHLDKVKDPVEHTDKDTDTIEHTDTEKDSLENLDKGKELLEQTEKQKELLDHSNKNEKSNSYIDESGDNRIDEKQPQLDKLPQETVQSEVPKQENTESKTINEGDMLEENKIAEEKQSSKENLSQHEAFIAAENVENTKSITQNSLRQREEKQEGTGKEKQIKKIFDHISIEHDKTPEQAHEPQGEAKETNTPPLTGIKDEEKSDSSSPVEQKHDSERNNEKSDQSSVNTVNADQSPIHESKGDQSSIESDQTPVDANPSSESRSSVKENSKTNQLNEKENVEKNNEKNSKQEEKSEAAAEETKITDDDKSKSLSKSQKTETENTNSEKKKQEPQIENKESGKDSKVRIKLGKVYDSDPVINKVMQSEKFTEIRQKQFSDYIGSHFKGKELTKDFLDMIDRHITNSLRNELRKEGSHLRTVLLGETTSNEESKETETIDVNKEDTEKKEPTETKHQESTNENSGEAKEESVKIASDSNSNSKDNDISESTENKSVPKDSNNAERKKPNDVDQEKSGEELGKDNEKTTLTESTTPREKIDAVKPKKFNIKNAIKGIRSQKMNILSSTFSPESPMLKNIKTNDHVERKPENENNSSEQREEKRESRSEDVVNTPSDENVQDQKDLIDDQVNNEQQKDNIEKDSSEKKDERKHGESPVQDDTVKTNEEVSNKEASPEENENGETDKNKESGGFFGGIFNMFSGSTDNTEEKTSSEGETNIKSPEESVEKHDENLHDNKDDSVKQNADIEKEEKEVTNIVDNDTNSETPTEVVKDDSKLVATLEKSRESSEDMKNEIENTEVKNMEIEKSIDENNDSVPQEEEKRDSQTEKIVTEEENGIEEKSAERIDLNKGDSDTKTDTENGGEAEKITESTLNEIFQSYTKIDPKDDKSDKEAVNVDSSDALTSDDGTQENSILRKLHAFDKTLKESVDMEHEKSKYSQAAQDFHKKEEKPSGESEDKQLTETQTEDKQQSNDASNEQEEEEAKKYFNELPDDDPMKTLCLQHPLLQACKNIIKKSNKILEEKHSEPDEPKKQKGPSIASYIKSFTRTINGFFFTIFETVVELIRSSLILSFQYSFGIILPLLGEGEVTENIVRRFYAISVGSFGLIILFIVDHFIFFWYFFNSSFGPSVRIVENLQNDNLEKVSQEEVDELNEQIEDLKKNLSVKVSKEQELIEKIASLEKELKESNTTIDNLQLQLVEEKNAKEQRESQNEKLQDKKCELEDVLSDKEAELKVAQQTIQSLKKEEETKKAELKKMEEKFFFVIKDLDTKDVRLEKMSKKQKELESTIEEKEKSITELEDTLCQNSSICDELNEEKKTLETQLEDEKKNIETLQIEIQVLQESLASMSVTPTNAESNDTSEDFEKVEQEKLSEEGEASKSETLQKIIDSTKLQAELRQVSQELSTAKQELNMKISVAEDLKKKHEEVEEKFQHVSMQYDETNKLLDKRDIELKTIRDFFADRESEFHRTNVKNSEEIKSLKKQLLVFGESEGQLVNLMKQIDELKEEILSNERQYKQQISSAEEQAHNNYIKMRTAIRECDEHKREKEIYRKRLLDIDMSPQFKKTTVPLSNVSKNSSERAESPSNSAKSGDENKSESPKPSSVALPTSQPPSLYSYPRPPPPFGVPPPPPRPPMGPYGLHRPPPPFMSPMHPMSMPPRPPTMPPGLPPRPPYGANPPMSTPQGAPVPPPGQRIPMSTPHGPIAGTQPDQDQYRRPPPNFPGYGTPTMNGSSGPPSTNPSFHNTPNNSVPNTPLKTIR